MNGSGDFRPISELIEQGRLLIESADVLTNEDDFRVWRAERNAWAWAAAETLEALHGEDAAQALRHAAATHGSAPDWETSMPIELERASDALRLLEELA